MKKEDGLTQTITTLLAYALPVLQFFYVSLPANVISTFLFAEYFILVSIFTAAVAYIMIMAIKMNPYFTWTPLQARRKKKNADWQTYTDRSIYTIDEIKDYQSKHKSPKDLKTIDSNNIVIKLLVPTIAISFMVFLSIGLASKLGISGEKTTYIFIALTILQIIAYVAFIVAAVVALASQFLRESGAKSYRKEANEKFSKAIELVRSRNGFNEYHQVSLITETTRHNPVSGEVFNVFYVKVADKYYIIVSDSQVDVIYNIQSFNNRSDADNFLNPEEPGE
jgi:hypothetical protein